MSKEKQEKDEEKPDLDKIIETSRRDFIRKVTIAGAVTSHRRCSRLLGSPL